MRYSAGYDIITAKLAVKCPLTTSVFIQIMLCMQLHDM